MTRAALPRSRFAQFAFAIVLALAVPAGVSAHTELETATPADGSTVPSPFDGPIRLTFSEELASGSKAELLDDGGGRIASATVDGPAATMQFEVGAILGPGDYEIEWTGVAVDGHVERGTVSFSIAPAPPTEAPTQSPTPTPTPAMTASAAPASPSAEPAISASPSSSPTPAEPVSDSGGEVVLPIIVGLLIAAGGAAYLVSRRGRTSP